MLMSLLQVITDKKVVLPQNVVYLSDIEMIIVKCTHNLDEIQFGESTFVEKSNYFARGFLVCLTEPKQHQIIARISTFALFLD